MANYRYPLDLLGVEPGNKVTQTRTLNMTTKMGDKFIIPADAPFFAESLIVFKVGTPTPLVRGIDYELIFDLPDIFTLTQKNVYGGIKFKDRQITGQVRVEMQVLGGPFLQPVQNTLETIARNKTNVNTATWGEIAGIPAGFPVLNHTQTSDDLIGFGEVNTTLREILSALLANAGGGGGGESNSAMVALLAHVNNPTLAHNKSAVGLGNVPNYAVSTYEESDLGVNNKLTTPALVKYLIAKYSGLSTVQTIQQDISILNRDVGLLQQNVEENNINVANLSSAVASLSNQFENVRKEFANVLIYISDLTASIENIQSIVQNIKIQIDSALETVSQMELVVNQLKLQNENIEIELSNLVLGLSDLTSRVESLEESSLQLTITVSNLSTMTLYPTRRFISAGSFHFSIKKGESRRITLIGAGAAGGVLIPIGQEGLVEPRGQKGGDTVLWLNTDLTNGSNGAGDIVLKAEGGYGGQSSKQSAAGVDYFGQPGPGGQTTFTGLFNIVSNSVGAGGVAGNGAPGVSHPGAVGQTIQGRSFGAGGASAMTAASGSAGAMIVAQITNTFEFDLNFTVEVGKAPANILGNNYTPATPGLFILELN